MKKIQIIFPNTEIWEIPVNIIIENRANYYVSIDGFEIGGEEWQNEFDEFINDEFEIKDWIRNNMLWEDLRPHASRIENYDEYDYEVNMSEAKFNIVK